MHDHIAHYLLRVGSESYQQNAGLGVSHKFCGITTDRTKTITAKIGFTKFPMDNLRLDDYCCG